MKAIADEAASQVSSLKHLIVLTQKGEWAVETAVGGGHGTDSLTANAGADEATARTSAEDPIMIIYTSGNHRPSKRRGAFPLRLSDQIRAGHVARARSAPG